VGHIRAAGPRNAGAATLKAGEDSIVRNAMKGGKLVVVVVLGAGHDLTESIWAQDPNCGYIRLMTHKVAELSGRR
jgi:hypothetical protein